MRVHISTELRNLYRETGRLYPGIGEACSKCRVCCTTYGWLLREEAEMFMDRGEDIIQLNTKLCCLDSFERDADGERMLEKIPTCKFYKDSRCSIQEIKPFDCRLYPVKVRIAGRVANVGINSDCYYFLHISERRKRTVIRNIEALFRNMDPGMRDQVLEMFYQVERVSKPKDYVFEKILGYRKKGRGWVEE